jgi:hypothetical protein
MDVYYEVSTENMMKSFYDSLSEKDRRRYAAVESCKLGHGGVTYVSSVLLCDEKTIQRGMIDLGSQEEMLKESIRNQGGGRKSKLEKYDNINKVFLDVLRNNTAGDPMDEKVKWTNLSKGDIRDLMEKRGLKISRNIVRKLLKKNGYVKRKPLKKKSIGVNKDRDEQFGVISELRDNYEKSSNPIISIDAKKKEPIGDLYRDGRVECTETIEVLDHDFAYLAEQQVTPYAVYDIKNNECFANLGTSNDTAAFACDSIKLWWNTIGKNKYPFAKSILILADGGGSNASRNHIFKESLQNLANDISIELRIAHYPPYTSKWNPIEHRVFPHITRALAGVILSSVSLMKELVKNTKTKTGLKVFVRVSIKIYEKGIKAASDLYETANIEFDRVLPRWNYVISPTW